MLSARLGRTGGQVLSDVRLGQSYSTSDADLIRDFYIPCLNEATVYLRAVGYFRASLFSVVGLALSDFAERGGTMRLVCSPSLSTSDVKAIRRGLAMKEVASQAIEREIDRVLEDPRNRPVASLLATLIANETLEIRIAHRPNQSGIFHAKIGLISDGNATLSFSGSSNETFSAWDSQGNYESFEVFRSWDGEENWRVETHRDRFERLWSGHESQIETLSFSDAAMRNILSLEDHDGLDHALGAVREQAVQSLPGSTRSAGVVVSGSGRTLLEHQIAVLEAWTARSFRGIVKHATGAGKTVTVLEAIRRWTADSRPALVVVPSEILVRQWLSEAVEEYGRSVAILQAGAGQGRNVWSRDLPDNTRNDSGLGPRLTIATIQTASTEDFAARLQQGDHLLLVVDEVHRAGAATFSRVLEYEAGGRLGLSATPERYGDPHGTRLIFDYFGGILDPVFSLADAIRSGRLVPYDYYVHQISLDAYEEQEWEEATQRIRDAYARLPSENGRKVITDSFRLMLIQRARIAKKASAKVGLAAEVVASYYTPGDRWLVYCDDTEQLTAVRDAIAAKGYSPLVYHTAMEGSPDETLRYFEASGGVLVAIKCLDEGVDIPSVNAALILASSTNPREFIQRRGRVLRTSPGKLDANVRDALVVPRTPIDEDDVISSLVRKELSRAIRFADGARNRATLHELELIARRIGMDAVEGIDFDFEDEDEDEIVNTEEVSTRAGAGQD